MTSTPNGPYSLSRRRLLQLGAAGAGAALVAGMPGVGESAASALGPAPAFGVGTNHMRLVKNWDFGTNGNIPDIATMNSEFLYHDQFGTIDNGGNYGAVIVAPDASTALSGQPVEDPSNPTRAFTADSLQTYLVPLNGATTVTPANHNVGCGSFMAQYTAPDGGALLGQNLLWETRVRYVTPPYFWFAIWTSGNIWVNGAEIDVIESFGYDNGGGSTNFDGRFWHSNSVGGLDSIDYSNWSTAMAAAGIGSYDASEYHTWQLLYNDNDTYQVFVDGIVVQSGNIHWTVSGTAGGQPINMYFLFDAGWGHNQVASVDHDLPASELAGKLYEWDYSRIYLSDPGVPYYSVVNRNSGKALSIDGSSAADHAHAVQWTYQSVPSQQWQLKDAGGGYTYLVNRNSGKYLSVHNGSTDDGAPALQWTHAGASAEHWQLQDAGGGFNYLVNRNSGKVLSVDGSSTDDGAAVLQWANIGAPADQWAIAAAGAA